jgi:diguanylate cyclase (GGDEF)-like protein
MLSQIIQESPTPTFVINDKHIITHWNKACENLTGISANEMIGTNKQWSAFYSEERPVMADLLVDDAPEKKIDSYYYNKYRQSNVLKKAYEAEDFFSDLGKRGKWLFFTAAPLSNAEGKVIGGIESLLDVTTRRQAEEALRRNEKRYRKLSITDELTLLYNSRHFYNQLKSEIVRANRYSRPLSLLLLDIDNFKNYNDKYGHMEGDKVLAKMGKVIGKFLRKTDSAYRYGGDEFTVILPETGGKEAINVAERIRKGFESLTFFPTPEDKVYRTLSIGITHYIPGEELSVFIKRTDKAMYMAKKQGKNRSHRNQ